MSVCERGRSTGSGSGQNSKKLTEAATLLLTTTDNDDSDDNDELPELLVAHTDHAKISFKLGIRRRAILFEFTLETRTTLRDPTRPPAF